MLILHCQWSTNNFFLAHLVHKERLYDRRPSVVSSVNFFCSARYSSEYPWYIIMEFQIWIGLCLWWFLNEIRIDRKNKMAARQAYWFLIEFRFVVCGQFWPLSFDVHVWRNGGHFEFSIIKTLKLTLLLNAK